MLSYVLVAERATDDTEAVPPSQKLAVLAHSWRVGLRPDLCAGLSATETSYVDS